ncbi:MAG: hypothetical protein CMJ75_09835 [Planctomycetaceae bacterium]|nr:hypothetical protein [Planctomycetaceae bacterium]
MSSQTILAEEQVDSVLEGALDAGEGLLRLTSTWVPRSCLPPEKRIKLPPMNTICMERITEASTTNYSSATRP